MTAVITLARACDPVVFGLPQPPPGDWLVVGLSRCRACGARWAGSGPCWNCGQVAP